MRRSRSDYQRDRIGWQLQRQAHAKEAAPDCKCILCLIDRREVGETIKRLNLERQVGPPCPF